MLKIQGIPELKKFKKEVEKYLETIVFFLGGDIEVVGDDLKRLSGTGYYKEGKKSECSQRIYKEVILTKQPYAVQDKKQDKICNECVEREGCGKTLEMAIPILHEDENIGVIGFYCSTEEQREKFLNEYDRYMELIYHLRDFITSKVYEVWIKEIQLEREDILVPFINSLTNGVLVVDQDNKLVVANNFGMRELKLSPEDYNKTVIIEDKNEEKYNEKIYQINIGEKEFILAGKFIPIGDKEMTYYTIFIFNKIEEIEIKFYELAKERNLTVDSMIGKSKRMMFLKEKIKKVANTKSTVLVTGESGTGKELVARAIHAHSERKGCPFIPINCGAIPDALLESELFGYVKGAFSGANPNGRMGKFELANGGVIFLDEIGDMPLYLQVKLLRVLQERKVVRIGSNNTVDLDIRIIAATNVDIKKKVKEKKFREDLYYRLNVIPMEVPNLKSRGKDIFLIIDKLIEKYNVLLDKYVHTIGEETKKILLDYSWPGNVRELENVVEFMINLSDERGILTKEMLPDNLIEDKGKEAEKKHQVIEKSLTIAGAERLLIENAVKKYGSDTSGKKKAAKALGIGIATLYRKIEKYNI